MAGYIGSKSSVTQVDGYTKDETDALIPDPIGGANGVTFNDNVKAKFGAGSDLQIYHDGSNSVIKDNGTGKLIIDTDGTAIEFQKSGLETLATFATDGAVSLYHNNSKKLETTTTGVKVDSGSADTYLDIDKDDNGNGQVRFQNQGTLKFASWLNSDEDFIHYGTSNVSQKFYTNGSESMHIRSDGNIDIGSFSTTGASPGVQINPTGSGARSSSSATGFSYHYRFYNPNGQCGYIMTNGSATSFVTSSDYRLKENVVDLTSASARINQLNPSRFNFIADGTDTVVDGFIAHEVATVVPEAVSGTKDAVDDDGDPIYQGIDQSKLVPLLTAALQEALAEITSLKTRVQALEDV